MARKKRARLKFDEDSVNKLLQEIYDDTHNIRAKIIRLYNKWEVFATQGGEIAAIGDQIIKLISAEGKNQDQKIALLKYLKDVVYADKKDSDNETKTVNDEDRNNLIEMVRKELTKKEKK